MSRHAALLQALTRAAANPSRPRTARSGRRSTPPGSAGSRRCPRKPSPPGSAGRPTRSASWEARLRPRRSRRLCRRSGRLRRGLVRARREESLPLRCLRAGEGRRPLCLRHNTTLGLRPFSQPVSCSQRGGKSTQEAAARSAEQFETGTHLRFAQCRRRSASRPQPSWAQWEQAQRQQALTPSSSAPSPPVPAPPPPPSRRHSPLRSLKAPSAAC